uniref:Uncharacterized protein n=1 Tax=Arundo donax TaxID=35708 RepID=A0A0A9CFG2_ARUDO
MQPSNHLSIDPPSYFSIYSSHSLLRRILFPH